MKDDSASDGAARRRCVILSAQKMSQNEIETIHTLINLYALAIDTWNYDLFDEVFTSDVVADYGEGAVWTGLANFKQVFIAIHAGYSGTQHTMSNIQWVIKGNSGYALSYGHYRLIKPGTPGGDHWEGQGYNDDKLVKIGGKWRISHRINRITWSGGNTKVIGADGPFPLTSMHQVAADGKLRYLTARQSGA